MNRHRAVAIAEKRTGAGNRLDEPEQQRLIRTIESAIEVRCPDEFHAWMRGPFHALLPHDSLICLELVGSDGTRQLACLHHRVVDTVTTAFLDDARHGLAVRLALAYHGNRRQTSTLDGPALKKALQADRSLRTDSASTEFGLVRNAAIHRIRLLSGASYCLVLLNVAADRLDRCRHLFKLLSLHLKMALSRALTATASPKVAALTPRELDILRFIAKGRSNREISVALGISPITLKGQVARLYRKLDVQNRADAVARGLGADGGA